MNATPLYVAAIVCGLVGIFSGALTYLDAAPSLRPSSYRTATAWLIACIALLFLASFSPPSP